MTRIGDLIKETRIKKNMKSSKLSKISGLSPTEISRLENGTRKTPSVPTIYYLSEALDLDVKMLIEAVMSDS